MLLRAGEAELHPGPAVKCARAERAGRDFMDNDVADSTSRIYEEKLAVFKDFFATRGGGSIEALCSCASEELARRVAEFLKHQVKSMQWGRADAAQFGGAVPLVCDV